ncbi:NAD(P)H-dependent oxidoreductase [Staphylococcus pseudintermedius]|uniref:NAD(P)H-dependent oxidoreductase n=1 Tax=Staphylococcus pseudintermedius TaxID=283734 RepID=UPI001BDF3BB0|nr:NAD(P)H-dependent oxidoreductase [Staphylococcus pseudintermedius]HEC2242359.1 NAD(P)H-dependent oxidoreductase [Staphylococcus delphini]EJA1860824.1 NAD(P)H-dependent oxidoreductase [Staphylococcus pseudintermedius]EKH2200380.1 NAD(P)H-dependent oxidoreductase [Staphylococcus pseudintermedius]EMB9414041.1 NAD(P)H-dependent oxidoreductase [Staphylococcus pseudintermedius]MBU7229182.1 NAD(P)H-dependent oxidoreductase [Staphylococcus pseudintermedius]
MKILAICGSRRNDSRGLMFLEKLKSIMIKEESISFEILTPNDYILNAVSTGNKFFFTGKDNEDEYDDGLKIKSKIIDSDFLIINSPVYSLNVSSDIKVLIDRISPWSHIFKLLGKPGLTVTVGTGRGHLEVEAYLDHMFTSFGMNLLDNLTFVNNDAINNFNYENLMKRIIESYTKKDEFKIPLLLEMQYEEHKVLINRQPKEYYEYKFWKESGLFDASSLQEYFDNRNLLT